MTPECQNTGVEGNLPVWQGRIKLLSQIRLFLVSHFGTLTAFTCCVLVVTFPIEFWKLLFLEEPVVSSFAGVKFAVSHMSETNTICNKNLFWFIIATIKILHFKLLSCNNNACKNWVHEWRHSYKKSVRFTIFAWW